MQHESSHGWLSFGISLLVLASIAGAVWIVGASARENIRFAQGTGQILSIIGDLRGLAQERPALFVGESNFLALLKRTAHPVEPWNLWNGNLAVSQPVQWQARLETAVPQHICRRLIAFFTEEATGIGLFKIEARDGDAATWRLITQISAQEKKKLSPLAVRAGCGETEPTNLALTFALK